MAKRIVAKIGSYEKNGETKGRYQEIGVILSNDNGEYGLLDISMDLAGIARLQEMNGIGKGDRVIFSIFTDEPRRDSGQRDSGYDQGGRPSDYLDSDRIPF